MGFISFLIIGALAGWLAGKFMRGAGFGIIGNIIVGILGSMAGGLTFGLLGLSADGLIGSLITATAGASILLFIVDKLKK